MSASDVADQQSVATEATAPAAPPPGEAVYTRRETADLLKLSLKSLDKLRPRLAPVCLGRRVYRYLWSDIIRYLKSLPAVGADGPSGSAA